MSAASDGHSIHDEPHMREGARHKPDPSEKTVEASQPATDDERREHTVWEEPGLSRELAGATPEGASYGEWLQARHEATGGVKTWLVTLGVALSAGPWAILGAFYGSGQSWFSILTITVFGPLTEEVMKVGMATYIVEKRPYLFSSARQVLLAAIAGGLAFSIIENIMYLHFYIPDPSPGIVHWRWTVCVVMHTGCSFIAGLGILRVWRDAWKRMARPRLTLAYPYLLTAFIIHGVYNGFAVGLALVNFQF